MSEEKDEFTKQVEKIKEQITLNKEETPMTDEELREAEQKILFPQLDSRCITFQGSKLELSPLPLGPSKKLMKLIDPVIKKFQTLLDEKTEAGVKEEDLANVISDSVLNTATFILNRYNYKGKNTWTVEELEEEASFSEMLDLAAAQVAVNGNNDFLLQGLRGLLIFSKMTIPQIGSQITRFLMKAHVNVGV